MAKFLILAAANLIFGYGALVILLRGVIHLPLIHPQFALALWYAGPIPLLITALWSAVLLWQLRKVSDQRKIDVPDASEALARGGHDLGAMPAHGPAAPELLARGLVWLAVFAMPLWLGWPLPFLWPLMLYGLWALVRWML